MLHSSHSVPVGGVGLGVGSGGDMYDLPFLDLHYYNHHHHNGVPSPGIMGNGSAGMGMNIDAVVPDNSEMKEHYTSKTRMRVPPEALKLRNYEVIARHQKRSGLVDEAVGTSGYFTNAHDFVISDSAFYDNSAWCHTDNSIHYINTVNSVNRVGGGYHLVAGGMVAHVGDLAFQRFGIECATQAQTIDSDQSVQIHLSRGDSASLKYFDLSLRNASYTYTSAFGKFWMFTSNGNVT